MMPRFQSRGHSRGSSVGTSVRGIFGRSSSKGPGASATAIPPPSVPNPASTPPKSTSSSLEAITEASSLLSRQTNNGQSSPSDKSSVRSSFRRSVSLHSTNSRPTTSYTITHASHQSKSPSSATLALSYSPERGPQGPHISSRPTLSISTFSRKQKSVENVRHINDRSPLSAIEQKSSSGFAHNASGSLGPAAPIVQTTTNGHNPTLVFQHIHDMASKRISTLDYLRKAHDGRVYWFNTLLFNKGDLSRLAYFDPRKLSRRATNYLLLGFSLPTILDLNSQTPTDYLRALNALLVEFETYQSIHPPDGSAPSSLSRGRIPQMFKRATQAAGGKGRRSSSAAAEIGLGGYSGDDVRAHATSILGGGGGGGAGGGSGGGAGGGSGAGSGGGGGSGESELLPGEEYTLLLTPSLPFEPDFFETFATLCDVLIDCYTKLMGLINSPEACVPGVGDLFAKADSRVRKILVAGVVREFEDASRHGVKGEMAGVGKVVLGGLM